MAGQLCKWNLYIRAVIPRLRPYLRLVKSVSGDETQESVVSEASQIIPKCRKKFGKCSALEGGFNSSVVFLHQKGLEKMEKQ